MPAALILLVLAVVGWAWWTGRLRGMVFEDAAAGAALLLGLRLATTGKLLFALPFIVGAVGWAVYRHRRKRAPAMSPDEARRLLGVQEGAGLVEIGEAHRRLIAKVHPDTGGSEELAVKVNAARDLLVAELNRRTPRAS